MRNWLVPLTLLALSACCAGKKAPAPTNGSAQPPSAPVPSASTVAPKAPDAVTERAAALVTQATKAEPSVTPVLIDLAKQHRGEMVKLAFRLKTQASTERKIRKILANHPEVSLADVRIDDALRYTMRVDDEPAGHYVAAVRETLKALEAKGHSVAYVKNYWPMDDNYSGINSVLKSAGGLYWELQFHTTASFDAQSDTRPQYEEIRKVATPLERKRVLFDVMTKRWNEVPVPRGVLEKGALHANDQVKNRTRP